MIRDRIVVGLSDSKLSESLQLDPELTLEKAVSKARQSEAVKQQQPLVRGASGSPIASGSHRQSDTHLGVVSDKQRRGVCCCLQTCKSVVYMLVMGLVLGQSLMVISTADILL